MKNKHEPSADDFASFCKSKKPARSAAYYCDKDLIAQARGFGCGDFADSCANFLEERGELTQKQRNALAKWDDHSFDYETDDDEDHWDGPQLSFGDVC